MVKKKEITFVWDKKKLPNSGSNINNLVKTPYKYGFSTFTEKDLINRGLNQHTMYIISKKKKESNSLFKFRIQAYHKWKKLIYPEWGNLKFPEINYNTIIYYSAPKMKKKISSLDDVDSELLRTFEKLGIPLTEQNRLMNAAVDAVFDSVSLGTTFQKDLEKYNIIFCSMSEAILNYSQLVSEYLGSVIPIGDNYFTALNSAVFTDGSFCYIPPNVSCPLDLSTYFRINDSKSGQFERTLIVADQSSKVNYLEGCTAPQYDTNQLHAAIVELLALENAAIYYSTVQNWYAGNELGKGGIYNFVTKRGLCSGSRSHISWTQVETGSSITWKYPSCILIGKKSLGEFYSIALTKNYQQADTGTKMTHIGISTFSRVISKGISVKNSKNSYRGLITVGHKAFGSRNYSQCDSLLIEDLSNANTFPSISSQTSILQIEHEASISKLGEKQIFYFAQRGISLETAVEILLTGFCKEIFIKLPLEFAIEANQLLNLTLEESVA